MKKKEEEEKKEGRKTQDLIDLNSSNKVTSGKLVEPLIPSPENVEKANSEMSVSKDSARRSFENNPFDQVLQETAKNLRKMQDPFEMIFEKDLDQENKTNSPNQKLRRSASESHLAIYTEVEKLLYLTPEIKIDTPSNVEMSVEYDSLYSEDLSILDMSAINDTLSEQGFLKRKNDNEKTPDKKVSQVHGYSEPDRHTKSHKIDRCNSLLDLKTQAFGSLSQSSSINSLFFDDPFNKAFREISINSGISNISKISYNSKNSDNISISSNGLLNKAFIGSNSEHENQVAKEDSHSLDDSAFESDLSKVINRSIRKEAIMLSKSICEIGPKIEDSDEDLWSERAPWEDNFALQTFLGSSQSTKEKTEIEAFKSSEMNRVNPTTPKSKPENNARSMSNRPSLLGGRKNSFTKSKIGVLDKPNILPKVLIKPATEIVETKLKIKPEVNLQTKKGPMKAVIPLNEMHKKKSCINFEPVKKVIERRSNLPVASSTPKFTRVFERGKSSPAAASTPVDNRSPCKGQVRRSFKSGELLATPSPRKVAKQRKTLASLTPNTMTYLQQKQTSRLSLPKVNYHETPKKRRSVDGKIQNKENAI